MNRPDLLEGCLDGLLRLNGTPMEVIVTAYMYSEENLSRLTERFPGLKIVRSDSLRGFSENNNLALREASGEYVFVVNDDTVQEMPVVDHLLADIRSLGDKAAAVSPKIVFPDGKVQTCGRAPWNMWKYMRHYLHLVDETRPGKWTMKDGLFRTGTLNGACFLARKEVFRQAGWFDETYTFTPEDIALGQKFREMGFELWCDADAVITHLAGGTVSSLEAAIKPTRVKGALLFYSKGSGLRYLTLGCFIKAVEALRRLKYAVKGHKEGYSKLMYDTSRTVSEIVFSPMSTKEIFKKFYLETHAG